MNTTFFSEMLQSIADRSRALIKRERREAAHERSAGLIELCEDLCPAAARLPAWRWRKKYWRTMPN